MCGLTGNGAGTIGLIIIIGQTDIGHNAEAGLGLTEIGHPLRAGVGDIDLVIGDEVE